MKFEIGKAYQHTCGEQLHIVGKLNTIMYGKCLMAEVGYNKWFKKPETIGKQPISNWNEEFKPVGCSDDSAQNYIEIPLELFKLCNFDLDKKEKIYCQRQLKLKRILNETH